MKNLLLQTKLTIANITTNFKKTPILEEITKNFLSMVEELVDFYPQEAKLYCTNPAASSHHQNYIGGLIEHSFKLACWLSLRAEFAGLTAEDCAKIGFAHDLCKIKQYYFNIDGSIAVQQQYYSRHAALSIEIAEALGFNLTPKQKACIALHMAGAWWKEEDESLVSPQDLVNFYRAISATQWADMKACE